MKLEKQHQPSSAQNRGAELGNAILTKLRVRDLSLLLSIAGHRSLTAAAEEFGLTQPAASRWLKDVEQLFSAHLFKRDRMVGMTTTELGELVITQARTIVADVTLLSSAVETMKSGVGRHLRLGVIPFVSSLLISRAVSVLISDPWRITVTITEAATAPLMDALRMEELDAVIGRCSSGPVAGDMAQEMLFRQQACLIVNPANPLARKEELKLAHLGTSQWLLPPETSPTRVAIQAAFISAKLPPPNAEVETASTKLIHLLVSTHPNMIGVVPAEIGADLERLGGVRSLRFPSPFKMPSVGLICHSRHRALPQIKQLRQSLRDTMAVGGFLA